MTDQPTTVGEHARRVVEGLKTGGVVRQPSAVVVDPHLAADLAEMTEQARAAAWRRVAPARFQGARLADVDQPYRDALEGWATDSPENLLLLGPVGTGKTHAALAAVRRLVWDGWGVRFLPVVELLDLLRPGGPEGIMAQLAAEDVLVLDDLGHERPTDWTAERLGALVNRRWMEALPIVATSNLEPKDLREALGERTWSRLAGDATVVRLPGDDRRRKGTRR